MQPQQTQQTQLKPHVCIVSGPVDKLNRVRGAFTAEGVVTMESDGHGLSSHPDPITAHAAGAPNSGHTPGTPHPETLEFIVQEGDHNDEEWCEGDCGHVGQTEARPNPLGQHVGSPYEPDDSIAFLAVEHSDPDWVTGTLSDSGWQLRMLISPILQHLEEDISAEDRMARIEHDIAVLRGAPLT